MSRKNTAATLVVAAAWFGMLLGVSFLATPAKFLAPSLTLGVALDIGRQTFAILNKVEWLFSAVLAGWCCEVIVVGCISTTVRAVALESR